MTKSDDSNGSSGAAWKAPANEANVSVTGLPGFAELRARVKQRQDDVLNESFSQEDMRYRAAVIIEKYRTCRDVLAWIDELSGCEETS